MEYVPPCVSRDKHPAVRQAIAQIIVENQAELKVVLPGLIADSFACLAYPGEHDLLASALIPLVQGVLQIIAGVAPVGNRQNTLVSHIFSQSLGIARRCRMEAEYRDLGSWLHGRYPDESEERRGARLALLILGYDATIGTLACSLRDLIGHAPQVMADLAFETMPSRTGVPYVDRKATVATVGGGRSWEVDDVARVCLGSLEEGASAKDRNRFFGAGSHTCLGRTLFLNLWSQVACAIRAKPGMISLVHFSLGKNDVFRIPEIFTIKVHASDEYS